MSKPIPIYLQRIRTFYNPLDEISETDIDSMAAIKDDLETLLKKYSSTKTKLTALEPTFFGAALNENPKEWLKKFDTYTTLNKTDEADKLVLFGTLLNKTAACWFENLKPEEKRTWAVVRQKFVETHFNSNAWINTQRLENRKLQTGETCTSYINNLLELAQLTNLSETELCKSILRGLPEKLRWQVVSFNPKTMDETIQRVLLTESMLSATDQQEVVSTLEERIANSKLDNFVQKLTSSLHEIEKIIKTSQQQPNSAIVRDKCNVCGRTNHTTDNCFFKRITPQYNEGRKHYRARYQQRNYRPQYQWRPSYRNNMMGNRSGYQQYQQNYDTERRHYSPPTSTQQHNPRIQRDWQQYQQNQIPVGQQNNGDGTQT